MTKQDLIKLQEEGISKLREVIVKQKKEIKLGDKVLSIEDCIKQYDPFLHDVNDPAVREKRALEMEGEDYEDQITGEIKASPVYDYQEVNRLQFSRQKQIVQSALFFECGSDIHLEFTSDKTEENEIYDLIKKVWRDNKLDFETERIVERRMVETHCAELWFDYKDEQYWEGTILQGSVRRPGYLLLCKENGDDIYPVFDEYGDFIALGREYKLKNPISDVEDTFFEFYSEDQIIKSKQDEAGQWETIEKKEGYGFLNIIYHSQKRPEWADIQPLADREENNISNIADTNDFYGDPTMVVEGEAKNLPSKGEVAKVIQVTASEGGRGGVSFVQPESMVESKKLELDIIKQEQFDSTYTPDLSFTTMSKLMANGTSGVALRLLFMGPQLKGNKAQKHLKEMLTRRCNLIRKMLYTFKPTLSSIGHNITPNIIIKDPLPVNQEEMINNVTAMVNAKLMSRRTAIQMIGAISDPDAELRQIIEEEKLFSKNIEKE